jgi:hypothetical protein
LGTNFQKSGRSAKIECGKTPIIMHWGWHEEALDRGGPGLIAARSTSMSFFCYVLACLVSSKRQYLALLSSLPRPSQRHIDSPVAMTVIYGLLQYPQPSRPTRYSVSFWVSLFAMFDSFLVSPSIARWPLEVIQTDCYFSPNWLGVAFKMTTN